MATTPKLGSNITSISKDDKPWNIHKAENCDIGGLYGQSPKFSKYAQRMGECAEWLEFSETEDHDRKLKLSRAYFCHVRNCPICQWRKTLALTARFMSNLPAYLELYPDYAYIYVVLTSRNCGMDELRETIKAQNDGVKKLLKRLKRAGVNVHGYIRTNEVTKGDDGLPHPHVNLILAVNKSYFTDRTYLAKMKWVRLWRECMGLDYDPSVFVSRVKRRKKKDAAKGPSTPAEDLTSGILEVTKYSVKPADMVDDPDFLYGITEQCHKLRFIGTGGCLKNIFKDGSKTENEIDDDDMLLKKEDSDAPDSNGFKLIYLWYERRGYLLGARRKFSSEKPVAEAEFRMLLSNLIRAKRQNE